MVVNRFPAWKYVLIVAIILMGVFYAIPPLYGVNPAIQVAGTRQNPVSQQTENNIKSLLTKSKIDFKSINYSDYNNEVLIRFAKSDTQLKAKSYVEAAVHNKYAVALAYAPATPGWLAAIGGRPMKMGLDLRGGVHMLLQVDVNSVIEKRQKAESRAMTALLREKQLRYSGVSQPVPGEVVLQFRDLATMDKAASALTSQFPDLMITKQQAGLKLLAKLSPEALIKARQGVIEQTITVLQNRVNELGLSEPIIQQQGKDRISVDLPGVQNAAQANKILGSTATVEFHMVDTQHDVQAAVAGDVPMGDKVYKNQQGEPVLLKSQVVLNGSSITSATSSMDSETGQPQVNIRLGGGGEAFFSRITGENVGKPMATVYIDTKTTSKMVDGKLVHVQKRSETVINIATIQSQLGNSFRITGLTDPTAAKNLALLLRAGALPANMYVIAESTVGPSLGKDNIRMGILSVEIGFIAVVIFMLFYYGLFGLIADMALFANLILIVAVMSLLGMTLTLPGIAGIVLTVGMAIDANVLIFERIREELRRGMTPQAAIHAGYERAFVTIVDSNVTTLIVAVVLVAFGTGTVKGFAVTLIVGLLTSMFTAITGTRAVVNLVYGRRAVKQLSIGM